MMKHLLKMSDLDKEEIIDILNLADQLKYNQKHGIPHHLLGGEDAGDDLPEGVDPYPRLL